MKLKAGALAVVFVFLTLNSSEPKAQTRSSGTDTATSESETSSRSRKKPFAFTYMFTKRNLEETSFAGDKRNEKLNNNETYISPESISFDQHIIGFRYDLTDQLQLEAATSYLKSKVVMTGQLPSGYSPFTGVIREKTKFETGSEGMSDTRFGANYEIMKLEKGSLKAQAMVNAPTGSVEKTDRGYILPYSGQLGSGTWDIMPAISYDYGKTGVIGGSKLQYTLRTGRSDRDYRMGNQTLFDSYLGYDYRKMAALLLKARVRDWRDTSDPAYEKEDATENDPYVKSGTRWEFLASTRFGIPVFGVGALILEAGIPLYQDQKGGEVQLQTDFTLNSRLVASF